MTPRLPVQPDNWQWRTEAIAGGAAVLVDIDGVRMHYKDEGTGLECRQRNRGRTQRPRSASRCAE